MADPKFTPGPWRVGIDDSGGQFSGWPSVWCDGADATIVHRAGFHQEFWGDLSQRETLANARLIAAAPDLYAALDNMYLHFFGASGGAGTNDVMRNAKAALAKARG